MRQGVPVVKVRVACVEAAPWAFVVDGRSGDACVRFYMDRDELDAMMATARDAVATSERLKRR